MRSTVFFPIIFLLCVKISAQTITFTYDIRGNQLTETKQGTLTATVTTNVDAGLGSLRAAIACVADGGTVTYDQPATSMTLLSTPLSIPKNVTIQGIGPSDKPEITVPPSGITIRSGKTLTLQNVDIKSTAPTQTFSGPGGVKVTGSTTIKQ
jgi:pectate lyase